jgi:hypothetical protein
MLSTRSPSGRSLAGDLDWTLTIDDSESPAELVREMNRHLLELRGEMQRRYSELEVRIAQVRGEQTQWAATVGLCVWIAAAIWMMVIAASR